MEFINQIECPKKLLPGEYYHCPKTHLNYKRDRNGHYSQSTQPTVYLYYLYEKNKYQIEIANIIKKFFGLSRLNTTRINRLKELMPAKLSFYYDQNGILAIENKDFKLWFTEYKKKYK